MLGSGKLGYGMAVQAGRGTFRNGGVRHGGRGVLR